jgi:galactonate dehydratase
MRITEVRTYIPMVGRRPQCLVKIETGVGISGWGESGRSSRERAVAAAVEHYRDFLVGADPMARGALWQRLYRSQPAVIDLYLGGGRKLLKPMDAEQIEVLRGDDPNGVVAGTEG